MHIKWTHHYRYPLGGNLKCKMNIIVVKERMKYWLHFQQPAMGNRLSFIISSEIFSTTPTNQRILEVHNESSCNQTDGEEREKSVDRIPTSNGIQQVPSSNKSHLVFWRRKSRESLRVSKYDLAISFFFFESLFCTTNQPSKKEEERFLFLSIS